MPWKESCLMDERMEFVIRAKKTQNFRELCREYGISPKTGYKWLGRYREDGPCGLEDHPRKPLRHARQLSEEVICAILFLKLAHAKWGPRKIRELYRRHQAGPVPSESAFKRVLARVGLTEPRHPKAEKAGRLATGRQAEAPNDIWTVDFKGWWKDAQGLRVEPLTVRDEYSRMLLEMKILGDSRGATVRACFEKLFARHGLPLAIRSDNGAPFASQGLWGLSRLSAWWLALGIDLERNRPGCPQDNGAHERLHRDIRQELQAGHVGRDQAAFDLWRQEYNEARPHQALGLRTPSELYQPSPRPYQGTPDDLDYGGAQTRRIHHTGEVRYQGHEIFVSEALAGWSVALKPRTHDGNLDLWFSQICLGYIDLKTLSFRAVRPDSPEASTPNPKH
jgi:transposase InsO family protein